MASTLKRRGIKARIFLVRKGNVVNLNWTWGTNGGIEKLSHSFGSTMHSASVILKTHTHTHNQKGSLNGLAIFRNVIA